MTVNDITSDGDSDNYNDMHKYIINDNATSKMIRPTKPPDASVITDAEGRKDEDNV